MKRLKAFFDSFKDPDKDLNERVFLLLTIIADFALFIAFIGDLISKENRYECYTLAMGIVIAPTISIISIKKRKVKVGTALIATGIIFFILPMNFIFGGGLTGGSVFWYSFCYLYIGLILTGVMRIFMLSLLTGLVLLEFFISFYYPAIIIGHSREMQHIDSLISLLLVGFVIYIMVWFQNLLFLEENKRVKAQAKEIEELNKAQSRFFSSMSHEIRTPINTIIGLNEMNLRGDVSEEIEENAENIRAASRILLSLINDILDMSKMESGKLRIVNAPYDIRVMLADIVNMLSGRTKEKNLSFIVNVDPEMPCRLISDEVRLRQILINLLNNAVKYTERGYVSLDIECSRTEDGKALVTYTVDDTGMGIRKENIPYLFDAFRREDLEKNRYIEGTGLGLSIVKQLVDLMGGNISVNSVYTKGSTFIVTILQDIDDAAAIGRVDISALHSAGDRKKYRQSFEAPEARILVVDDNKSGLMVTEKLLRETRIHVDTARSGKMCLEKTSDTRYHAILMDHLMPEMDGIECLHLIREQAGGFNKDTPVVALTANTGSENEALYRKEGFDGYLTKPIDPPLLEDMLISILPENLVFVKEEEDPHDFEDRVFRRTKHKIPLLITTDSIADLPRSIIADKKIPVLPYNVTLGDALFKDGTEAEGEAAFRRDSSIPMSCYSADVRDYEDFFADNLSRASHILHISLAKNVGTGYDNACAAAMAFDNVTVFDSGHLSAGIALMVLKAYELSGINNPGPQELAQQLEEYKNRITTSFIVDDTEYMHKSGKIKEWVYKFCNAMMLHPVVKMRNSSIISGDIIFGGREDARRIYIKKALRKASSIDKKLLFIVYTGMPLEEAGDIKREVLSVVPFETVYLKKASSPISINLGPGCFGLIFMRK